MKKKKTGPGQTGLTGALNRALKKKTAFVPKCAPARNTTNVYRRLLVRDCDSITAAEMQEMSDALIQAGLESASIICELNTKCPNARLVSYQFIRIVCENRLWEVDLRWTFVCVP